MAIKIIKAKEFSNRSELENEVRKLSELTPDIKIDFEIKGTRQELENLHLSDVNSFYGIRCVITDIPTSSKPQKERPERGEIKKSGINL